MEKDRTKGTTGIELTAQDWNTVTQLSSKAQDYVFAELFRMQPRGGAAAKGVLPFGFYGFNSGTAGIVTVTGISSPTLLVNPFRALIGSNVTAPPASPLDSWREIRSVVAASPNPGDSFTYSVTLPNTVSNNRIDLIYAHVTLSKVTSSQTMYERDPTTGVISQSTLTEQSDDTVAIAFVSSAEASSPVAPALPSDGTPTAADFYIPLAYCYIAHPFTGSMSNVRLQEVAPVIPISRTMGAGSLLPGNQQYATSGAMLTATPFAISGIPHRPETYIPPTMCGKEERLFCFRWDGNPKSPAVNTTAVIDNSVDWRQRLFKWRAYAVHNSGASSFPWAQATVTCPSAIPPGGLGVNYQIGMGQSFAIDLAGIGIANGSCVALLGAAGMALTALSTNVFIYVDQTDGALKLLTVADPGANLFVWVEATGPYSNS